MVNTRFDAKEVESERVVIINERQGSENSPWFRLCEDCRRRLSGAPVWPRDDRPYARPQTMTRDDLYGHYVNTMRPTTPS